MICRHIYFLTTIGSFFHSSFGQLDNKFDISINGKNFVVPYETGSSAEAIANNFCKLNFISLGISEEDLKLCVDPVSTFVSEKMKPASSPSNLEPPLSVMVNIRGVNYEISLHPDKASIENAAKAFCRENSSAFGLLEQNLEQECVIPIESYLRQEIERLVKLDKSKLESSVSTTTEESVDRDNELSIPLQVNENLRFDIRFNPKTTTAITMATNFCNQQAGVIGVTPEAIPDCVRSVSNYLEKALQDTRGSPNQMEVTAPVSPVQTPNLSYRVTATIAGKDYDIEFSPSNATAVDAAALFCRDRGSSFGITPETLGDCVGSVSEFLEAAVASQKESAASGGADQTPPVTGTAQEDQTAISLTLAAMGREYNITFRPSVTSPDKAAVVFCADRASELQLTDESRPVCVKRVTELIMNALFQATNSSSSSSSSETSVGGAEKEVEPVETESRRGRVGLAEDAIKLIARINDHDYDITFNPNMVTPQDAAASFCRKQGLEFGISEENLDNCVVPLTEYLQQSITQTQQQKLQTSSTVVTTDSKTEPKDAIPETTVTPVIANVDQAATSVLRVTLNIMDRDFDVLLPENSSPRDVAGSFCRNHLLDFGLTEATVDSCIQPVSDYLQSLSSSPGTKEPQMQSGVTATAGAATTSGESQSAASLGVSPGAAVKSYNIAFSILGISYEIAYQPELASASTAATVFCEGKRDALGLTNASLDACVGPVSDFLVRTVEQLGSQ